MKRAPFKKTNPNQQIKEVAAAAAAATVLPAHQLQQSNTQKKLTSKQRTTKPHNDNVNTTKNDTQTTQIQEKIFATD